MYIRRPLDHAQPSQVLEHSLSTPTEYTNISHQLNTLISVIRLTLNHRSPAEFTNISKKYKIQISVTIEVGSQFIQP